jgi:hypothetical protein
MSKTSIAEAIVGWDKALLNAKTNATEVPGIQGYMTPLEEILAEARVLSASLEGRKALKQQESKDRRVLIQKGNVQVSRLRSAVKAFFGPNSERLIEFGSRPVRGRTGKKPEQEEVPPPVETPPAGSVEAKATDGKEVKPATEAMEATEAPRNPTTL